MNSMTSRAAIRVTLFLGLLKDNKGMLYSLSLDEWMKLGSPGRRKGDEEKERASKKRWGERGDEGKKRYRNGMCTMNEMIRQWTEVQHCGRGWNAV